MFDENCSFSCFPLWLFIFKGIIWKCFAHCPFLPQAYIDFEISEGEYDRTRQLYERLLERTKHIKVWISYAQFEWGLKGEEESKAEEEGREPDEFALLEERGDKLIRARGEI